MITIEGNDRISKFSNEPGPLLLAEKCTQGSIERLERPVELYRARLPIGVYRNSHADTVMSQGTPAVRKIEERSDPRFRGNDTQKSSNLRGRVIDTAQQRRMFEAQQQQDLSKTIWTPIILFLFEITSSVPVIEGEP